MFMKENRKSPNTDFHKKPRLSGLDSTPLSRSHSLADGSFMQLNVHGKHFFFIYQVLNILLITQCRLLKTFDNLNIFYPCLLWRLLLLSHKEEMNNFFIILNLQRIQLRKISLIVSQVWAVLCLDFFFLVGARQGHRLQKGGTVKLVLCYCGHVLHGHTLFISWPP